jgi:DNA end-binding protein Ku
MDRVRLDPRRPGRRSQPIPDDLTYAGGNAATCAFREAMMAERPIWRGHLRLAIVSCPESLHSILRPSGNLHFHFINPKTGHRVTLDEEVRRRELEKGYEFEKDHHVLLEDEDFASAKIDTSATMTRDKFVGRDAIHPIYFDTSYCMVPDGEAGQDTGSR